MRVLWQMVNGLILFLVKVSLLIACVAMAVLALLGAGDILALNLLGYGIPSATEFSGALMGLLVFNGIPYTQYKGEQVIVDILTSRLQGSSERYLCAIILIFTTACFVFLAWASAQYAWESFLRKEFASAAYAFPVYPFKIGAAFGAFVLALEGLRQCVNAWIGAITGVDIVDRDAEIEAV
jgi:TRAP-type C4-dicarboxylate transport system permease small subunit